MLEGKRLGMLVVLGFVSLFLFGKVMADETIPVNYKGVVIDERCAREKISDPNGGYANDCKIEENYESEIICRNLKYPESKGFFGVFDLFKTRLRVTPETLPFVIRTVMIVAFSVLAVSALWIAIWGYYRWIMALNNSPDEATKIWTVFRNGLFGLFFSLAAVVLTWGIFYAAGVRQSSEDFFQIGDEFTRYLSFPCEDLGSDNCSKYNYSCVYNSYITKCETKPENEKAQMIIENKANCKPVPSPVPDS